MSGISFFTPIISDSNEKYHALRHCDQLFDFGQRRVRIIAQQKDNFELKDDGEPEKSLLTYVGYLAKAILIVTVVPAALALVGKWIYRNANRFTYIAPHPADVVNDVAKKSFSGTPTPPEGAAPQATSSADKQSVEEEKPASADKREDDIQKPLLKSASTNAMNPSDVIGGTDITKKEGYLQAKCAELTDSNLYMDGYLKKIQERFINVTDKTNVDYLFQVNFVLKDAALMQELSDTELNSFEKDIKENEILLEKNPSEVFASKIGEIRKRQKENMANLALIQEELEKKIANRKADLVTLYTQHENAIKGNKRFIDFFDKYSEILEINKPVEEHSVESPPLGISPATIIHRSGIANQGNTCWLNSCVQSILTSPTVITRIDEMRKQDPSLDSTLGSVNLDNIPRVWSLKEISAEIVSLEGLLSQKDVSSSAINTKKDDLRKLLEKEELFIARNLLNVDNLADVKKCLAEEMLLEEKKQRIFQIFIKLRHHMSNPTTPSDLGKTAAELRLVIFSNVFGEYISGNEYGFQDPGAFYLMLLEKMNLKTPISEISQGLDNDNKLLYAPPKKIVPTLVAIGITSDHASVQTQLTIPVIESADKWKNDKGAILPLRKTKWEIDTPVPMIVVQLKALLDPLTGRVKESYMIKEEDLIIDLKEMLPKDADGTIKEWTVPTQYRLVSFAQNIGQYHWVAYGQDNGEWRLFDDSSIKKVGDVVGMDAHYAVYERIDQMSLPVQRKVEQSKSSSFTARIRGFFKPS